MKIFRFGPVGRIRIKGENSAPSEWKRSIWDKIKNNDLFTPINIHDENNIREIKFFFNKKVFVIGINLFLFTFLYSFVKDSIVIIQSRNNLMQINTIDFTKQLPPKLIQEQIDLINYNKKHPSKNTEIIIKNNSAWIASMSAFLKDKHWENNFSVLKSTLWPLTNDLLILLMISKYYWKRKKS